MKVPNLVSSIIQSLDISLSLSVLKAPLHEIDLFLYRLGCLAFDEDTADVKCQNCRYEVHSLHPCVKRFQKSCWRVANIFCGAQDVGWDRPEI